MQRLRLIVIFAIAVVSYIAASQPPAVANPHLTVLSVFTQRAQGAMPFAGVVGAPDGTLYGTTPIFGDAKCNCGTVYALVRNGTGPAFKVVHSFHGADGAQPLAHLLLDDRGDLFGTTNQGGGACYCGTVFELSLSGSTYNEHVLYRFKGGSDGAEPSGALIADRNGALYGLTTFGGSGSCTGGCGVAYSLTPTPTGYHEHVLYRFQGGTTDGAQPAWTAMTIDAAGDLFGTTIEGGNPICEGGCGIAFELTPFGGVYQEHVLHIFGGVPDGARPYGGVIFDTDGSLYGTTELGGDLNACPAFGGCGTVFKLAPTPSGYVESVVYSFLGGRDAYAPLQALIADRYGALYGASPGGGLLQIGVLFKLTPSSSGFTETVLHQFKAKADGYGPYDSLIVDKNGRLFGTTISGPWGGNGGEIFSFTQ